MSPTVTTRGSRRQHLAHVRRFHQHHAIHRRGGDGIGKLRIDQRQAGLGARDFRAPRGQLLLAPLHFERVGLRHLQRAARPLHLRLPARRSPPRADRPAPAPRAPVADFSAAVALSQRLRYWSNCAVEMSSSLYSVCARSQSLLGALHLRLRRVHGRLGVQLFLRPRAVLQLRQARLVGRQVGRAAARCRRPAWPSPRPARSPPAPVAIRPTARPAVSRSRCAINWSRSSRAITCPFFTASPSSTVRSISRPAVLNAMLTSVSSMLPETTMRLSGRRAPCRGTRTPPPRRRRQHHARSE